MTTYGPVRQDGRVNWCAALQRRVLSLNGMLNALLGFKDLQTNQETAIQCCWQARCTDTALGQD